MSASAACAWIDATLTIDPPPRSTIEGRAAWVQRMAPPTTTACMTSHTPRSSRPTGASWRTIGDGAALFTSTSMPSKRSSVVAKASTTDASDATSSVTPRASRPSATRLSAWAAARSPSRSATTTRAPWRAIVAVIVVPR
jgi:hypothetical protein